MKFVATLYNAPESPLDTFESEDIEVVRDHIKDEWLPTIVAGDMIAIVESEA